MLRGRPRRFVRITKPVAALIAREAAGHPAARHHGVRRSRSAIGIPAGIVSAVKKDTAWDYGANLFALSGISTPNFWLGIMMILLFSVQLGWLPASGYVPLCEDWQAKPRHHHHAGLRAGQRASPPC